LVPKQRQVASELGLEKIISYFVADDDVLGFCGMEKCARNSPIRDMDNFNLI